MGVGFFTSSNDKPKHDYRHEFNKYCREHQRNQETGCDALQNLFFDYVNKERSQFFDSNKELYRDVLLRDNHANDHGCVDFVQEGLIAKLHVLNPAAEKTTRKRERSRKNAKLLAAKRFIEDYCKMPVRAVRIDGEYNGTIWTATVVQVSGLYQRNL